MRGNWAVLVVAFLCCGASPSWCVAASGSGTHTPGTDTTYSWTGMDMNAVRKSEKPIILYIYDHEKKNNSLSRQIEQQVFPSVDVKKAFADFAYVMVRKDSKGWPLPMLAQAERGAALYVMTCDCTPVNFWSRSGGSSPAPKQVAAAAEAAKAANKAALDKMKKEPPKEFKQPEKTQEVAGGNQPKEEEKPPVKVQTAIPGLKNEEEEKTGKTGAAQKTEPKKSGPVLTDE